MLVFVTGQVAFASEIDLSSGEKTHSAELEGSAVINVAGENRTILAGDALTAAEAIALQQVLQSGGVHGQTIELTGAGNAVGGAFALHEVIKTHAPTSLLIPQNVTAVHDFGVGHIELTGDLVNHGSLFGISSNQNVTTGNIFASNIFNSGTGLISTNTPSGFSSVVSNLNLSLSAAQSITNAGSIISAGNLSLVAGNVIENIQATAQAPLMQAAQNLSFQAPSIINAGTFSALNGTIAVNAADVIKPILNVTGGDWLADSIRFNAGDGHLNVNVNDVMGEIFVHAGTAAFKVNNGTHGLNIQEFTITGDPDLIFNGTGAFTSPAFNSLGGVVDITTNDSITFTGTINTTPTTQGNGGNVSLRAGTFINTRDIITNGNTAGNAGSIYLDAPSIGLGLTGSIVTGALTANGGATTGSGGDITLMARTTLQTGAINARGGATGNGGAVCTLAEMSSNLGAINTSAGAAGGAAGGITLNGPFAGGSVTTGAITATGRQPTGSFNGITGLSGSTITTGAIRANGSVNLYAFQNISLGGVDTSSATASGGDVTLLSEFGGITVTANGIDTSGFGTGDNSGNIELFAPSGPIAITGNIDTSSSGGAISGGLTAFGTSFTNTAGSINTSNTGVAGAGSPVKVIVDGNINVGGITANAGTTGSGGDIVLMAGATGVGSIAAGNITARGAGIDGNGGSVLLQAPGLVTAGAIDLSTSGTGARSGGGLTLVSGTSGAPGVPAQGGNVSVGNITTSGITRGGNVVLANLATNGLLNGGNITTNATGLNGRAGSMAFQSHGAIALGILNANAEGSVASTTAAAGSIFSSSAAPGLAITAVAANARATINGNANRGGNIYGIIRPGSTAFSVVTQTGDVPGQLFYGNPTAPLASINGTATITVTPTSVVGLNAGGFDSINAPAGTLTVNANGDDRLLVPIMARGGDVSLASLIGTTTGGRASPLLLMSAGSIAISGAVTSTSATNVGGNVYLGSSGGAVSTGTITASGTTAGGNVLVSGASGVNLPTGTSIAAQATAAGGTGGTIHILSGRDVLLGAADNRTGSVLNVSGTTAGEINVIAGNNILDYGVSMQATSTTGPGGSVSLQSAYGYVDLFNAWDTTQAFNANIDVSSISANGGTISISGPLAVNILRDNSVLCCTGNSSAFLRANGATSGGAITLVSSLWAITASNALISANATQAGGVGGYVGMSTAGEVVLRNVDVSGSSGGTLVSSGGYLILEDGGTLNARGTAGTGGQISLYSLFGGYLGGTSGLLDVSGSSSGGALSLKSAYTVDLANTSINAQGTSGRGGVVTLASFYGDVNANGNVNASSANNLGGHISLIGATGVSGSQAGTSFNANGALGGGSIALVTTDTGSIQLSNMGGVTANATSGRGGTIMLATVGTGSISSTVPITSSGSSGGGAITLNSNGALAVGNITADATTSSATSQGGAITLSAMGPITAGTLRAAGPGGIGGKVLVTTAQPNGVATGVTLSASATPSGTINVGAINVTGTTAGIGQAFTSGGAAISAPGATTISTAKLVLPKAINVTANTTISSDTMPGGVLRSFNNTASLTLTNFSLAGQPVAVANGNIALGAVTAGAQGLVALGGGTISYGSLNLAAAGPVGGNVNFYSLSGAPATINGTGDINTASNGSGRTGGSIELAAPLGSIATSGAFITQSGGSIAAPVDLIASSDIRLTGNRNHAASTLAALSSGGVVDIAAGSIAGSLEGTAGTSYTVNATTGSLTLSHISSRNGAVSVSAPVNLTILPGSTINANEGDVSLRSSGTGVINIGANSRITALSRNDPALGNGDVNIFVGATPPAQVTGPTPANVTMTTLNGGRIFFGTNGISTVGPTNVINAIGSNVVFSTGARPANSIVLGGGVVITADPPTSPDAMGSPLVAGLNDIFAGINTTPLPISESTGGGLIDLGSSATQGAASQGATSQGSSTIGATAGLVGSTIPSNSVAFLPPSSTRSSTILPTDTLPMSNYIQGSVMDGADEWLNVREGVVSKTLNNERLINTQADTVIDLPQGKLLIKGGSFVYLSTTSDTARVVNVQDRRYGAVRFESGGQVFPISLGEELIVANNSESADEATKRWAIGRRRTERVLLQNGVAQVSEVALIQYVRLSDLMSQSLASNKSTDKRFVNAVLKSAAALMLSTSKHGPFKQFTSAK